MTQTKARAVAFYLPQYFPIPENDEWWGPGFTEWTNVARGRPLFPGHEQPLIPGELGFYDLRVPETRLAQARLAQQYGVEAFAYWHYWFGDGITILERPLREMLDQLEIDLSFCLAWANESWTGVWHGAPGRVLREQKYLGRDDEKRHFESILPALTDPRYLRVGGRPVFYVYRPQSLPSASSFLEHWRGLAEQAGLPGMYFVAEVNHPVTHAEPLYTTATADGFDACAYVRFPTTTGRRSRWRQRLINRTIGGPRLLDYEVAPTRDYPIGDGVQPCVWPNWDNTPRSGRGGTVLRGAHPDLFEQVVEVAAGQVADAQADEGLLWIKSWNEWAEGNHLEPDTVHGRAWLEALARGLGREPGRASTESPDRSAGVRPGGAAPARSAARSARSERDRPHRRSLLSARHR